MSSSTIHQWLTPHVANLAKGIHVGRVLPFRGGQGIGPWIFLDHMGPHTFPAGEGMDIASHPHIGLSTVTYLFEGEIEHKDSLGSIQKICPGDVNWMTAGKGIVHCERTEEKARATPRNLHGLQAWVALPVEFEEVDPSFEHQECANLPTTEIGGIVYTLIAGNAFNLRSPVKTFSRLFYIRAEMPALSRLKFDSEGQDVAFYVVSGTITAEGQSFTGPGLLHFVPGSKVEIQATDGVLGMLLGGDPFPEHRRIWWNFVSSRPERVEEAKTLWRAQGFPQVPGETDFVPLP